jgi:hypothetical protein
VVRPDLKGLYDVSYELALFSAGTRIRLSCGLRRRSNIEQLVSRRNVASPDRPTSNLDCSAAIACDLHKDLHRLAGGASDAISKLFDREIMIQRSKFACSARALIGRSNGL